jgi:hypothetical protein
MATLYRVNFQAATNEDLRQAFALTDSAGTAVNLTGASLRMALDAPDGSSPLELSTTNGRIVLADAGQGQFDLRLPTAELRTLAPGVYRHDLVLTLAGRAQRIWDGTLTLAEGVTL